MIDWLVESFLIWGSRWLCWLDFLGCIKDIKHYYRVSSMKEWRTTYDNKNIHVYWWTKLLMMSICMAILYALGLKLAICFESERMSMYLYLGLLWHEQEQEQDFMHWLGHIWSAQPGRGVTSTWEIPLLLWSTRDVVTHWTC